MKTFVVIFLVCLLLVGTVSAKAASSSVSSSIAKPASSSGIYTLAAFTDCSEDSASVDNPLGMGELDVDSIPDGASVSLDGSPWTYPIDIGFGHILHMPIHTPFSGSVEPGTHTITIDLTGYKSYTGNVKICAQKVSYVHKTLTAVPTTTLTTTVTTATTTTATTTATTAVSTSAATTATTSVPTSATTSATGTTTTAATIPASTSLVAGTAAPPVSGSLSVTTTPAGAAVYIDGVQRGISPATIPGLAAGSHTVLLKLNGFQDLSTPVSITAGTMNEFSTGLTQLPAGGTAVPATTAAGAAAVPAKTQSPGFETAAAACVVGALLLLRKTNH